MATTDRNPYTMCSDCALIVANDDDSGMPPETVEAHRAAMAEILADMSEGRGGISWVVDPEDHDTFSVSPCDACGTSLAGDRFGATILGMPDDDENTCSDCHEPIHYASGVEDYRHDRKGATCFLIPVSTDDDTCSGCGLPLSAGSDVAAHWNTPHGATVVAWSCSATCSETVEARRGADGSLIG